VPLWPSLRWHREAIWTAVGAQDWARAAESARWMRAALQVEQPLVRHVAARELAVFSHGLRDDAARDALLKQASRYSAAVSLLERRRFAVICAASRGSASRTPRLLTMAMRRELQELTHRFEAGDRARRRPEWGMGTAGRTRPNGDRDMQDVLELLRVCHADDDEPQALGRLCALLRDRLGAIAVAVWANQSAQPLASAGTTRAWARGMAERARITGLAHGPEAAHDGIEAGWPVMHGDTAIGAIACRWLSDRGPAAGQVERLLPTAAAACTPLIRAWLARLTQPVSDTFGIIGEAGATRDLRAGIQRAANVPYHVLIEGESGSGKELVARAVHQSSARRHKRFCAINCAALSDDLLEAELFGHARGAFTGAVAERSGLFEEASGGTLFLDEIADLSPRGQAKVLRVIQDGEVRRLGENYPRRVDVRIVAATNKPLRNEAAQGRFREDLRYRLDVLRLVISPLRDRRDDIPLLIAHFWRDAAARVGSRAVLDPATVAALCRYEWPGNVRELQNVIAALAVHGPARGRIGPTALPDAVRAQTSVSGMPVAPLEEARRRFECDYVKLALERSGGRRIEAARSLGVTRQGLAKLMTRLGLET
jgi:DNA-binding NtrC family response regulator